MAIQKVAAVTFTVLGDGTSTVVSFDLLKDPYILNSGQENWFTTDKKLPSPVSAVSESPSTYTASLSGTVVTITFANPASSTGDSAGVFLIFPN